MALIRITDPKKEQSIKHQIDSIEQRRADIEQLATKLESKVSSLERQRLKQSFVAITVIFSAVTTAVTVSVYYLIDRIYS